MMKISGSGSNSQRIGSADPDPQQNVMDLQHWQSYFFVLKSSNLSQAGCLFWVAEFCPDHVFVFRWVWVSFTTKEAVEFLGTTFRPGFS
jgi:hypothetical protein